MSIRLSGVPLKKRRVNQDMDFAASNDEDVDVISIPDDDDDSSFTSSSVMDMKIPTQDETLSPPTPSLGTQPASAAKRKTTTKSPPSATATQTKKRKVSMPPKEDSLAKLPGSTEFKLTHHSSTSTNKTNKKRESPPTRRIPSTSLQDEMALLQPKKTNAEWLAEDTDGDDSDLEDLLPFGGKIPRKRPKQTNRSTATNKAKATNTTEVLGNLPPPVTVQKQPPNVAQQEKDEKEKDQLIVVCSDAVVASTTEEPTKPCDDQPKPKKQSTAEEKNLGVVGKDSDTKPKPKKTNAKAKAKSKASPKKSEETSVAAVEQASAASNEENKKAKAKASSTKPAEADTVNKNTAKSKKKKKGEQISISKSDTSSKEQEHSKQVKVPLKENNAAIDAQKENVNPVAKSSKKAPSGKSALTESNATSGKQRTVVKAAATKPKPKKKRFDQVILHHMATAMAPFSLKELAQELNSTEQQLHHTMLSLKDKQLVFEKEFVSSKGRSKTLIWANLETKETTESDYTPDRAREATQELQTLLKQERYLQQELEIANCLPSNAEVDIKLKEEETLVVAARKEVEQCKSRIKAAKGQTQVPPKPSFRRFQPKPKSAAELARERCPRRMKMRINAMRTEWRNRMIKCKDFIDTLADAMEKKPKEIHKLLDIETDEMAGVKMPPKQEI